MGGRTTVSRDHKHIRQQKQKSLGTPLGAVRFFPNSHNINFQSMAQKFSELNMCCLFIKISDFLSFFGSGRKLLYYSFPISHCHCMYLFSHQFVLYFPSIVRNVMARGETVEPIKMDSGWWHTDKGKFRIHSENGYLMQCIFYSDDPGSMAKSRFNRYALFHAFAFSP